MGFFSAIADVVGAGLGFAGNRAAADEAREGAERSAQISAEAADRARAEYRQAAERGVTALQTGRDRARAEIDPILGYTQEAPGYLRNVMLSADTDLTPDQQQGLDDLHRDIRSSLAASGLRGAGRAGVAAYGDAVGRYRSRAADQNQARRDQAAGVLEARGANARTNLGNLEADTGRGIAATETRTAIPAGQAIMQAGDVAAGAARDSGRYSADAMLANTSLAGNTVGSITALVADDLKRERGGLPRSKV